MLAFRRFFMFGALVVTLVSSAQARTDPNSFINRPAPTHEALMKAVQSDPVVLDRYMRHFAMTRHELIAYFSTLRLKRLTHTNPYTVYNVPDSGVLRSKTLTFRKGTLVWIDAAGKPVLKESCGNPLTRGPNKPVSVDEVMIVDMPIEIRPPAMETELIVARIESPEPAVPQIVPDTPTTTPPIRQEPPTPPAEPPAPPPAFKIPPFLFVIPPFIAIIPKGGGHTPPPVPEPGALIVLAAGVGMLVARRARSRC